MISIFDWQVNHARNVAAISNSFITNHHSIPINTEKERKKKIQTAVAVLVLVVWFICVYTVFMSCHSIEN